MTNANAANCQPMQEHHQSNDSQSHDSSVATSHIANKGKTKSSLRKAEARARIKRTVNPSVGSTITADVVVQVATFMKDNPGPGSHGTTLTTADGTIEEFDYYPHITGPLLELEAMIAALQATMDLPGTVAIHTTAKDLVKWLSDGQAAIWKANGWHNAQGRSIKNAESWDMLLDLYEQRRPLVAWVDRHTDSEIKRCLTLAGKAFHAKKPRNLNP